MKNSKLYKCLKELDSVKKNRLTKFISSEYLCPNEDVRKIIEILLITPPERINNWDAFKEDLYTHIKIDPDSGAFRSLISKSNGVVMDFFAFENLKNNKGWKTLNSIQYASSLRMNFLLGGLLKKLDRLVSFTLGSEQHLIKTEYLKLQYKFENYELKRVQRKGDQNTILSKINLQLEQYYLSEKLRFAITQQTWKKLTKNEGDEDFVFEWIDDIDPATINSSFSVEVYHSILKALLFPEKEELFYELKKNIDSHLDKFPRDQQKEILDSAINYCLNKVNQGKGTYMEELFDLYNYSIKKGVILSGGTLSPWTFKNVVSVGLRLGKYNFIEEFIDNYGLAIAEEYQESAIALARGQLSFYRRQFSEVPLILQSVEYKEYSYNTSVKSLILASYYELDEYEVAIDHAISFKKYLSRHNKLSKHRKDYFRNLCDFTLELIKHGSKGKDKINDLRKRVEECNQLASKTWLLEKVDELLGVPTKTS